MLDPEQVVKAFFGELLNPHTPVILEYGWIAPGLAYELSTNTRLSWFLVTVVNDEGEVRFLRYGSSLLDVVKHYILTQQNKYAIII